MHVVEGAGLLATHGVEVLGTEAVEEDEALDHGVGAVGNVHVHGVELGGIADGGWDEVVLGVVDIVDDRIGGRLKAGSEPELQAGSGIHRGDGMRGGLDERAGAKAVSDGERRGWSNGQDGVGKRREEKEGERKIL